MKSFLKRIRHLSNCDKEIISEPPKDQQADTHTTLPQQSNLSNAQWQHSTPVIPADFDGPMFPKDEPLGKMEAPVPVIPPDFDGQIPGYMPMKQVRRRDRWFILIGLGLLVVIALAVGGYFYFNRSTPEKTLDAFCSAMQGQDYQTAYNQLSNSLQMSETELDFANTLHANGKVNTCTHSSANTTNNKATANVTIVTNSGQASNSQYYFNSR